jgi:hypothetical protein
MFKKLRTLFRSEDPEDNKEPVSVERKSIYDVRIGDIVMFGFNDLMEIANQQFEVKNQTIFQGDDRKSAVWEMRTPEGQVIFVDTDSETEHIYIYKEVFFHDIEKLVTEDWDNFNEYLLGESNDAFSFNEDISEEIQNKHWLSNTSPMFKKLFLEGHYNKRNSASDTKSKFGEVNSLCIITESSDREYRFRITTDGHGATQFFSGRRIEPHNVEKILGLE